MVIVTLHRDMISVHLTDVMVSISIYHGSNQQYSFVVLVCVLNHFFLHDGHLVQQALLARYVSNDG